MNSKIELINEYIVKCNSCSKNDSENFVQECISLFKNEIPNITEGLDMYNNAHLFDVLSSQNKNVDCSNDVKLLRKKFLNYKASLEYELERPRLKSWCKLKEPKALVSLYNVIAKKNTKEKQKQWLRYRLH